MRTHRYCVICIFNQLLRVADYLKCDESQKDQILVKALKMAGDVTFKDFTAPEFSALMYRAVTEISGIKDPYYQLRREQNQMVMDRLPEIRERITAAPDRLFTAAYYALLGNIIDYGGVRLFDAEEVFNPSGNPDIFLNHYPRFKEQLQRARQVLILGDNAGEAVFDLLLIEEIKAFNPGVTVYYGVRSHPAINDVMREDAEYIGIHRQAQVLETGTDCAGTVVGKCSDEFRTIYYDSDIIISKGQGNFETLEGEPESILYVFKVKCDIVANYSSLPLGALIFAYGSHGEFR